MSNGWIDDERAGEADADELFLPELRRRVAARGAETADLAARFASEYEAVDRVLDLACGPGVHAIELAKRGFEVRGIDISERYVGLARARAAEAGVSDRAEFTVADMRDLDDFAGRFDAVTNRYNSFGYFSDPVDLDVIASVYDLLPESGVFVLELRNREWVAGRVAERGGERLAGRDFVCHSDYDQAIGRLSRDVDVYDGDGGHLGSYETDVRLYAPVEMRRIFERVGFEARVARNLGGDPLTEQREWFTVFGVKRSQSASTPETW